jgi:hypothetical protein
LCFALVGVATAEAPESPYRLTWSFPDDDLSAIDVDRGDLSKSRFEGAFALARYLESLPKPKKAKKPTAPDLAPQRELRIEQIDGSGKPRTSLRYVAPLAEWRRRLGEPMVERLEDEFDAHLRMILPRKNTPKPSGGEGI